MMKMRKRTQKTKRKINQHNNKNQSKKVERTKNNYLMMPRMSWNRNKSLNLKKVKKTIRKIQRKKVKMTKKEKRNNLKMNKIMKKSLIRRTSKISLIKNKKDNLNKKVLLTPS